MGKNKILLIDMYGVIIKESKGYFIPYALKKFDASEHNRIIDFIRKEQMFTKAQSGEYDFCLLSNDVLEWSEFLMEHHGLNKYFKYKIVSGEVHMRKPEKEIFTYTLKKLACNPNQCIFVDNSTKNLLPAKELGIRTILFNRDGEEYDGSIVNDFDALGKML